jgi:hypothetical protein
MSLPARSSKSRHKVQFRSSLTRHLLHFLRVLLPRHTSLALSQVDSGILGGHTRNMPELFACLECRATYTIKRRRGLQPSNAPVCVACKKEFPPSELGDWLIYEPWDGTVDTDALAMSIRDELRSDRG